MTSLPPPIPLVAGASFPTHRRRHADQLGQRSCGVRCPGARNSAPLRPSLSSMASKAVSITASRRLRIGAKPRAAAWATVKPALERSSGGVRHCCSRASQSKPPAKEADLPRTAKKLDRTPIVGDGYAGEVFVFDVLQAAKFACPCSGGQLPSDVSELATIPTKDGDLLKPRFVLRRCTQLEPQRHKQANIRSDGSVPPCVVRPIPEKMVPPSACLARRPRQAIVSAVLGAGYLVIPALEVGKCVHELMSHSSQSTKPRLRPHWSQARRISSNLPMSAAGTGSSPEIARSAQNQ